MRAVARRVIWFEKRSAALADPRRFFAYVMAYGSLDDVAAVIEAVGRDGLRWAVDNAPPGVIDRRSWHYWNLVLFGDDARPLPRRFPDAPGLGFPGR